MNILVLSDIHGKKENLDCLKDEFKKADFVLFAGDFAVLKRLKVSIFKTFQPLFGIIKVSKKAVFFYDDTRNRKSKKANADCMY